MPHPFAAHLRRVDALPEAVVGSLEADAVDDALAAGQLPAVPPGTLRLLVDAWSDYRAIRDVDPGLVGVATLPSCARALRARGQSAEVGSDREVAIREGATREVIANGTVRGRVARAGHPGLAAYAAHVDHVEGLERVTAHRWLALERAEADGVLRREYGWPDDLNAPPWAVALLPETVAGTLHARARSQAVWAGADLLRDLMTSPPRRQAVVAVARSGGKLGVVACDPEGRVTERVALRVSEAPSAVPPFVARHEGALLVLPTRGIDRAALGLPAGMETVMVRDVALSQAAKAFRAPRLEALAQGVAERAQDPRRAWSRLDPSTLGLVEYQQNLDSTYVALALGVTAQEASRERARAQAPAPRQELPLVHQLGDLKPGMLVSGTVTQITPFGAFVNLGIGHDGLIHISELADHRVASPTEAVHLGQRLTARVLEVDLERQRISLSLRRQELRPRRREGARKEALAALDKLFK